MATIGLKYSNVCLGLDSEQTKLHQLFTASCQQAPAGSRIFNPGISGTGFCKIPGSWDLSSRDYPEILSRDFTKKVWDPSRFPSQLIDLVYFIHFGGLICL